MSYFNLDTSKTLQSTHCIAAVWDEIFIVSISFLKVFQTHGDTKILSSSLLYKEKDLFLKSLEKFFIS